MTRLATLRNRFAHNWKGNKLNRQTNRQTSKQVVDRHVDGQLFSDHDVDVMEKIDYEDSHIQNEINIV
jgi:hypothetical protein